MPIYQGFCEGENPTPFSEQALTRGDAGPGAGGNRRDSAPVHLPKPQVKAAVTHARAAKGRAIHQRVRRRRTNSGPRQPRRRHPEDVSLIVEVVVIAIVVSRRSRTLARLAIPEILGRGRAAGETHAAAVVHCSTSSTTASPHEVNSWAVGTLFPVGEDGSTWRSAALRTFPPYQPGHKRVRSRTCSKARPGDQKSLRPSRCAARSGRVRWYTAMRCGPGMSSSVASPFGNPNRWPNLTPRAP